MALPAPAAAADATTSTCYGNPAHGRIEGAVALPAQGNNFEPYAQRGVELGRTWVHASVRDIVVDAYRALETGQPDITFVYGETGLQTGGPMPPHRTHQAGVSVDFMVPVRGADGRPATLPRSAAQRFGYGLEFDSGGRWQGYRIDHGNPGIDGVSEPVVWLDGLDIPMVRFFNSGFAENGDSASQPIARPEGRSLAAYGHNMVPVRHVHSGSSSPIFNYPYERSREALETLRRQQEIDAWLGVKLRYVNPLTGGAPMPTIGACMQLLPAGFRGLPHRSTDGTVYSVVEGSGRAIIGGRRFDFAARDTFVVPSWATLALETDEDAVLFSFSDRPVLQALGQLREEFLPE